MFHRDAAGRISFTCDPFGTIKEPECLGKWQLIKTNQMVDAYQATLTYYQKLAPMQDKLFKAMEHELDDMGESEKWKQDGDEPPEPDKDEPDGDTGPRTQW
jgi:hypothetical protein